MSVTFTTDLPDEGLPTREPCLCTQMSAKFSQWVQYGAGEASEMKAAADPKCYVCKGSGVELTSLPTTPEVNFSNINAEALLQAMDLSGELWGEMSIAQARRGVMRARARRSLEPFVPKPDWAGVFGGARFIGPLRTESDVAERLERFARFVEMSAKLGATKITWS